MPLKTRGDIFSTSRDLLDIAMSRLSYSLNRHTLWFLSFFHLWNNYKSSSCLDLSSWNRMLFLPYGDLAQIRLTYCGFHLQSSYNAGAHQFSIKCMNLCYNAFDLDNGECGSERKATSTIHIITVVLLKMVPHCSYQDWGEGLSCVSVRYIMNRDYEAPGWIKVLNNNI